MRPIIHRASTVEIIVPYGDPRAPFHKKCAFDVVVSPLSVLPCLFGAIPLHASWHMQLSCSEPCLPSPPELILQSPIICFICTHILVEADCVCCAG